MKEIETLEDAHGLIKDAMKEVKQELLLTLEDGTDHIAYLHSVKAEGKNLIIDFSTLSEDRKAEIGKVVEQCVLAQVNQFKRKPFSF